MTSRVARPCSYGCFRPSVGLFLISSALAFSGCRGEDSSPTSSTSAPVTLNSDVLPVPLSATEADRFLAVAATTGNQYYAAGFTTVTDDSHMAVARFGPTGGLDTSFGSNGIATVNVAVGAGKRAELARSIVVQSDGKIVIAGPIEHDTAATGDAARDTDIAIARFDTTGQLDKTFGTNGIRRLDLSTGTVSGTAFRGDTVWGLTLLRGDSLLIVGGKLAERTRPYG
jgi:uncharacterized delta-60 repeat protein